MTDLDTGQSRGEEFEKQEGNRQAEPNRGKKGEPFSEERKSKLTDIHAREEPHHPPDDPQTDQWHPLS